MLGRIKQKLKGPLSDRMYQFLMREAQYAWGRKPFGPEELRLLNEALVSQNLFGVGGKMVPAFEKEFARVYGVPYAVASTSGTAAIHTALGALDLNPGDEVITAPITDLGTVIPILSLLAVPVFADIDHTYNMDPQDVERKITDRTRAIVVVHIFGNPCQMDAMLAISRKHNIPLIEDCSQAHVTEYKGKFVGTIGDIGCFSFQQSKHMTTGDGGMTITSNKAYYEKMKLYVDKGFMRKGWGARAYGFHAPNYRMNELTAAVGLAQLKRVRQVVLKRHEMGMRLNELLSDISEFLPAPVTDGAKSSFWQYPLYVKTADIERIAKQMSKAGFGCSAGYTGKPIYLCSESLTAKKTFGQSQLPFNSPYVSRSYEYREGLCPRAEEALRHLVCMAWDEDWPMERVSKAAELFKETLKDVSGQTDIVLKTPSPQAEQIPASPSADEKKILHIGIVGCGQMGSWHYETYRKNSKVKVVAFCDTSLDRAKDLANRAKGKAYTDVHEMFQKERLDGVSICTVPSTHRDITLAALQSGVHVLCEKPLAVSSHEAQDMVRLAHEKRRILLTAFKFRFAEEVRQAKEILERKMLGNIVRFRLMFGGRANMSGTWFVEKKLSGGGVLIDNGAHAFDLIRHLFGEVNGVQAHVSHFQEIPVEDTAHISCLLQNGARGIIDVSWSVPVPPVSYLEIYGEEGAMLLDFKGVSYKLATWDDWKRIDNKTTANDAFCRQLDHFVDSINGGSPSVTTLEDGLKAQELIESAYASVRQV